MLELVRTAMIIAPHSDDEVLGVGGTIARLAAQGAVVHVVILTRGSPPRFSNDLVEKVAAEASEAHRLLGVAHTHFCEFPAAGLDQVAQSDVNGRLDELIRAASPDTLFVPFVGDIHVDHQLAFISAMVAARPIHVGAPVRIMAYETLSETNWFAPGIMPTFAPNLFVDISATLDAKLAAFAAYGSQVMEPPHERSLEVIRALAKVRGATVFREAAEAFMLIRQVD